VANGTVRELVLLPRVTESAAHQLSTASLVALLGGYFWSLHRRWPIRTATTAAGIGASWALMTVAFEFGLGHYVEGKSWATLTADYDLTDGRVWVFVLVWTAVGPVIVRRLQSDSLAPPSTQGDNA
jgi:lysylphosphatidylglycerol synthetase-like protein (DUF2156 family)